MEFSSQSLSPLLKSNFPDCIAIGSNTVPLRLVRNARARRYLLRLNPDLSVRLTVPRGGSISEAHAFLQRNLAWLERTARRVVARPNLPKQWLIGSSIYWRGELVPIGTLPAEADSQSRFAQFGSEVVCVPQDHSED